MALVLLTVAANLYLILDDAGVQKAGKPPKYKDSWVEKLNQEGFSVCGIDQQGCGFSEGLECYVDRFDHYVDDVLQFARLLPIVGSLYATGLHGICLALWLCRVCQGLELTVFVPGRWRVAAHLTSVMSQFL